MLLFCSSRRLILKVLIWYCLSSAEECSGFLSCILDCMKINEFIGLFAESSMLFLVEGFYMIEILVCADNICVCRHPCFLRRIYFNCKDTGDNLAIALEKLSTASYSRLQFVVQNTIRGERKS